MGKKASAMAKDNSHLLTQLNASKRTGWMQKKTCSRR